MSESSEIRDFDADLRAAIRRQTDSAVVGREARAVAASAISAAPPRRTFASWLALGAGGAALVLAVIVMAWPPVDEQRGVGSSAAQVTLDGVEYRVSAGNSLRIPAAANLQRVATLSADTTNINVLVGLEAFALPGVDPRAALVVRLDGDAKAQIPDARDYMLLLGAEPLPAAFCGFVDRDSESAPTPCRP